MATCACARQQRVKLHTARQPPAVWSCHHTPRGIVCTQRRQARGEGRDLEIEGEFFCRLATQVPVWHSPPHIDHTVYLFGARLVINRVVASRQAAQSTPRSGRIIARFVINTDSRDVVALQSPACLASVAVCCVMSHSCNPRPVLQDPL